MVVTRTWLQKSTRRFGKSLAEFALPIAERISGFHTAAGDYLPNRVRMLFNRYETTECDLMRRFLRPGQVVVDVGANVGYLARFFASSVGPAGQVFAFEPNPLIFGLLQKNVTKFTVVSPYDVALSSSAGESELFLAGSDFSVASLTRDYPATHVVYQDDGKLNSIKVKLVIGDEFLHDLGVARLDVLKIDVEGWELNVLAGLEQTIAASPRLTIFSEFNASAQQCAGRTPTELPGWFLDRRFRLAYADGNQLISITPSTLADFTRRVPPGSFVTLFANRD